MHIKSKVGKFLLFLLHPKRSTALIFKQLICLLCNIELGLATCIASNRNLILTSRYSGPLLEDILSNWISLILIE